MANTTDPLAFRAHGVDPQSLIEKITREKIYDSRYWKERCFALNVCTLLERAVTDLDSVGGVIGGVRRPCRFLCLVLKMLQLGPETEIVRDFFIRQTDFKYVRLLGVFYWRLIGRPAAAIYSELEPLLNDYRKIRLQTGEETFELRYMDDLVDELLVADDFMDTKLPRLTARYVLVDIGSLPGERQSILDDELRQEMEMEDMPLPDKEPKRPAEEGSIEHWNQIRSNLGLAPLRD